MIEYKEEKDSEYHIGDKFKIPNHNVIAVIVKVNHWSEYSFLYLEASSRREIYFRLKNAWWSKEEIDDFFIPITEGK